MLRRNLLSKKGMVVLAMVLFFGAISFGSIGTAIAETVCECDLNGDGVCDMQDWLLFGVDWGRTDCPDVPPAPVEKTGQTTSYATGDDGDLEKGVSCPSPRFKDNGDGTVTDNLTGLVWLKIANWFGYEYWEDALTACNTLNSGEAGLTDNSTEGDWRLPNIKELQSLIHNGFFNPPLSDTAGTGHWSDGEPFNGVQLSYYWSATTLARNTGCAWRVTMSDGDVGQVPKTGVGYVWPVRGGQ